VQRWEKDEGLPVHRHLHKKQGSVYAYRHELDDWFEKRRATVDLPDEAPDQPSAHASPIFIWAVLFATVILAGIAAFLMRERLRTPASSTRVMIAVLPFQNLGGGPNQEYVCDGLTEELITELAALDPKQLGIIARTSAMVYKSGGVSVRDIGKQLGVEYVVEGSVLFAPEKSRITVQLIRIADQSHVWAHTYDSQIGNLLEVEQEISRAVAKEVNVRVFAVDKRPSARASADPEAYRLYMEGRRHWYRRSRPDLEKSIALYEEAIGHDPKFAAAYSGLADSYNQLGYLGFRPLGITIPKAQNAAQSALAIDQQSAGAHAALGFINAMWLWEWKEAESHYQRAIELDPAYVPAHHYYALFLASAGRLNAAKEQIARALELDPLSASVNSAAAYVMYFDHQYERAEAYCRRALQSDPQYAIAHALLGWNQIQQKKFHEGIGELQRALELSPENPLYLATLGRTYFLNGRPAEGDRILKQLDELSAQRWVGASSKAIVYAAKGDNDSAIHFLEVARKQEDGFMLWLKVTPEFDSLRNDLRFQKLLLEIGLPASIQ
jgi:TolB-like protein/Tfp pilus assembly protein PilF